MRPEPKSLTELELLLESLCEDRLTAEEMRRLEQLVLASPEACWQYLTYLDLHGTLYWDAAGAGSPEPLSSQEIPIYSPEPPLAPILAPQANAVSKSRRRSWQLAIGAMSVCLAFVVLMLWQGPTGVPSRVNVVDVAPQTESESAVPVERSRLAARRTPRQPIELPETAVPAPAREEEPVVAAVKQTPPIHLVSSEEMVGRINEEIASRWKELEIAPSGPADEPEWMRRIYLHLLGRVPTVREAEIFLADQSAKKRDHLIDQLLDDSGYVRNFTTKWSNLLIGRANNSLVNRDAFEKFLRMSFAANRPWNQIVAELISAEGSNTENGATNFLIAHLNNNATPATAVCAKLFLGRQVHCNQCHNNPFDDSKQIAFWELNSFFQQTTSVYRQRRDPVSGRLLSEFVELATKDAGGPTYFETQTGLMRVAYPRYNGYDVDPSPETNRRWELARLMTSGEQPQLAAAFVNRMWEHFFGSAFTRTVDDMGPHSPASHPELLAALSEQFIQSGYDIKQLVRWICQSEPYQLSSRFSESNQNDDPSLGELPAFSRMYVRSMTAEQTYDSFLTATKAHQVGATDWTQAERNRQAWLQQFVVAFDTDENDESMEFEGSIGQALSLMNGPLIDKALDTSTGSFLGEIIRQRSSETDKIRSLCLATLSRTPTPGEFSSMKKLLRQPRYAKDHPEQPYQDLFWALLNSNEFASVH